MHTRIRQFIKGLHTLCTRAWGFVLRVRCLIGLHPWVDATQLHSTTVTQLCGRIGCKRARRRLTESREWFSWNREEVTEEQVKRLNRGERRRLCALHRRGLL